MGAEAAMPAAISSVGQERRRSSTARPADASASSASTTRPVRQVAGVPGHHLRQQVGAAMPACMPRLTNGTPRQAPPRRTQVQASAGRAGADRRSVDAAMVGTSRSDRNAR